MKRHRHSSFTAYLLWLLLPVFFLATARMGLAAPTITATKDDGVATGVKKVSGSTIKFTNTISNTAAPGAGNDATGVTFTESATIPVNNGAHTNFTAGTLKATPVAVDDTYPATVLANTSINTATSTTFSVVTNDFKGYLADNPVAVGNAAMLPVTFPLNAFKGSVISPGVQLPPTYTAQPPLD